MVKHFRVRLKSFDSQSFFDLPKHNHIVRVRNLLNSVLFQKLSRDQRFSSLLDCRAILSNLSRCRYTNSMKVCELLDI